MDESGENWATCVGTRVLDVFILLGFCVIGIKIYNATVEQQNVMLAFVIAEHTRIAVVTYIRVITKYPADNFWYFLSLSSTRVLYLTLVLGESICLLPELTTTIFTSGKGQYCYYTDILAQIYWCTFLGYSFIRLLTEMSDIYV